jgi:hypothetical protein
MKAREDCAKKRAKEYDKTVIAVLAAVIDDNNVSKCTPESFPVLLISSLLNETNDKLNKSLTAAHVMAHQNITSLRNS